MADATDTNAAIQRRELASALEASWKAHRSGRLEDAMTGYQATARDFPGEAEPIFRIGLVHAERGSYAAALETLRRAIAIAEQPHYHYALGDILERSGDRPGAIAAWRRAVMMNGNLAAAHARLGIALQDERQIDQAIPHLVFAARLRGQDPRSWNNLAVALLSLDRAVEAESAAREALEHDPAYGPANYNLARALLTQGREAEARPVLEAAVRGDPKNARAWDLLGSWHLRAGNLLEAGQALEQAVAADPEDDVAWVHLGVFRTHVALAEEAAEAYARAEALGPPDAAQIGSNRLFALQYSGLTSREAVFEAHKAWGAKYAPTRLPARVFANPPDPARRIRLGYISPRFHRASVAFLHVPVLEHHDRAAFEVHLYAEQDIEDDVTARIRATGATWTDTRGLSDDALAERMRADGIDIAIDLAGHTPGHRLTALPHEPAPVIGTWLDYFNTTGIERVDFLVSDRHQSPPDDGQGFTERVLRLPHCRYCWEPPAYAPEVKPPPLAAGGKAPVFGTFNRMAKVSLATREAWCALLRRVPSARLVLKNSALGHEAEREYFARWFTERGIDPSRLEWRGSSSHADMLAEYLDIDVALDTFPYNGGLTTLEALWMGRPVVALGGDTLIARQSKGILTAIGLPELCAADAGGFVEIAASLVGNPARLASLGAGLRERLRASPLLDPAGFTRELEALFREEWRRWCAGRGPGA